MNILISLTPELVSLINAKVESGRYASADEVVREALRSLECSDSEADAHACLRRAWEEGVSSADAGPLDFADLKAQARNRLAGQAKG